MLHENIKTVKSFTGKCESEKRRVTYLISNVRWCGLVEPCIANLHIRNKPAMGTEYSRE